MAMKKTGLDYDDLSEEEAEAKSSANGMSFAIAFKIESHDILAIQ